MASRAACSARSAGSSSAAGHKAPAAAVRAVRAPVAATAAGTAARVPQHAAPRQQRRIAARGILDSYRQQQAGKAASPVASSTSSESEDEHVVESLLLDPDVHFTEEDTPCPTDCVIEVFNEDELDGIFKNALPDALVVIDWFKDDCPACKYMAPGFHRMCRSASEHAQHVIFVKHNLYDDDHELTSLARRSKIKSVPQFSFHLNNGEMVESFATRDKARLIAAVEKHAPVAMRWSDEE